MAETGLKHRNDNFEQETQENAKSFDSLAAASQSSIDFWNNPFDDEDWNAVDVQNKDVRANN